MNYKIFSGRFKYDVDDFFKNVYYLIIKMNCCKNRLEEIVLRIDFLFIIEFIDLMI